MKQKWGESLSSTFSLGLLKFIVFLLLAIPVYLIAVNISVILGAGLAVIAGLLVFAVFSAAETIFISSVYHNITGDIQDHFDQQLVDGLFIAKK
jgi:ABC-type antimicrobial peptide transport system permease subunit